MCHAVTVCEPETMWLFGNNNSFASVMFVVPGKTLWSDTWQLAART